MAISPHEVRREPAQARSRARVQQILDAASNLIAERGLGPISMTDIANQADMALTAVYRYFPNKQSIVRELSLRMFNDDTETLIESTPSADVSGEESIAEGITEFWRRHLDQPVRLQLRAAIHADAELSARDLAESRRNAATIADAIADLTGRTDRETLERQTLLLVELIDSLMRLVTRVDEEEAAALVDEFTAMITHTLITPLPMTSTTPST